MASRFKQAFVHQVVGTHDFVRGQVAGLTDDEYFWEPVPGCWSVRRNEGDPPPQLQLFGEGPPAVPNTRPWICEHGFVWKEPGHAGFLAVVDAPPLTTIAWLMTHLSSCQITYHQDVFGAGSRRFDDLVPSSAADAVALFEEGCALQLESLRMLDDDSLLAPPSDAKPFEERQSWMDHMI